MTKEIIQTIGFILAHNDLTFNQRESILNSFANSIAYAKHPEFFDRSAFRVACLKAESNSNLYTGILSNPNAER